MTYHILTQNGSVISRSTVQKVTTLELQGKSVKEMFVKFDVEIYRRLKADDRGHKGSKPNTQDWVGMLEEDPDFAEEFNKLFSDAYIPEAGEYTPEVLEKTYLNVEVALPKDSKSAQFSKVTKRIRDTHGISIEIAYDNLLLNSRIYEVEYLDGHQAVLSANTIATNMFDDQ